MQNCGLLTRSILYKLKLILDIFLKKVVFGIIHLYTSTSPFINAVVEGFPNYLLPACEFLDIRVPQLEDHGMLMDNVSVKYGIHFYSIFPSNR